jgi:hypothetical protein
MNIINEPKYQDFNGLIHDTEKRCIKAEQEFRKDTYQMLKYLMTGCKNQQSCESCPFYKEGGYCFIEKITGIIPADFVMSEIKEED